MFSSLSKLIQKITSANTPDTVVKRDTSGNFSAGTITASLNGNAASATVAQTATSATSATTAYNIPTSDVGGNIWIE